LGRIEIEKTRGIDDLPPLLSYIRFVQNQMQSNHSPPQSQTQVSSFNMEDFLSHQTSIPSSLSIDQGVENTIWKKRDTRVFDLSKKIERGFSLSPTHSLHPSFSRHPSPSSPPPGPLKKDEGREEPERGDRDVEKNQL
jgi:hypothetical protein